jgi:Cu2+-exporting ATPase
MPLLLVIVGVFTYASARLYQDFKAKELPQASKGKNSTNKPNRERKLSQEVRSPFSNLSETTIQENFAFAKVSLVLVTIGTLFFPPLTFVGVLGILYTMIPILKNGYNSLFKEHKINMAVIESIMFPWLLIIRGYFVLALLNWLHYLSKTLVIETKILEENIRKSLFKVFGKLPSVVWLLKNGVEIETPIEKLKVGDIIVCNTNGMIAVDGIITQGSALINQQILFGDLPPLEKGVGEQVFASTTILSGQIFIRVEKWGSETFVAKDIEIVTRGFRDSVYCANR